ncbi:unnamed protein product [Penicillium bialowiezense]
MEDMRRLHHQETQPSMANAGRISLIAIALYVINVAGWPEVVMCLPLPLVVNMAATSLTLETPRVPSNDKLTAVSLGLGFNGGPHGQLKGICHLAVVKLRSSPVSCI